MMINSPGLMPTEVSTTLRSRANAAGSGVALLGPDGESLLQANHSNSAGRAAASDRFSDIMVVFLRDAPPNAVAWKVYPSRTNPHRRHVDISAGAPLLTTRTRYTPAGR